MTRSGTLEPPAETNLFVSRLDNCIYPPSGSGEKLLRFVGTENPWGAARGCLLETSSIPFVMQIILGEHFRQLRPRREDHRIAGLVGYFLWL